MNTLGFLSRTSATEFVVRKVASVTFSIVVVGAIAITFALVSVNSAHATPSDIRNAKTSPSQELYRGPQAPT